MSEKKNKHKRWNRAAKASQFTRGAGGEMVYIGRHYSYQGDERSYRQSMRLRMVLAAIMGVAQVAGGLMPIPALYLLMSMFVIVSSDTDERAEFIVAVTMATLPSPALV